MNKKFFGKKVVKFGFVAFALALGLAACGDDGSTNGPANNHEDTNISSVESEENLPSCTESGEGFVNFINGTKEGFICKDRKWVHYDMIADVEENLPGCTGSREGLSAYLYEEDRELNCVEGSWDVVGEVASSSSSEKSGSSSSREKDGSSSSVAPNSSSSVILSDSEGSSIKDGSKYDASANTLTDLRDGQVYKTVTIGTQTWMAENLNYALKFNYSSYTSSDWCYENKASNCDKYGRLYTWSAVMDSAAQFSVNAGTRCGRGKTCTPNSPHRGICPEGWHVPTNEEYSTLYTFVGGSSTAGSLLKSTSGWNDYNGWSGNGTDKYGFSVLPAGYGGYDGDFGNGGSYADLWSASEDNSGYAWYQCFGYDSDYAYQDNDRKYYGQSLRCLKDSSPTGGEATSSSSQAQPSSSSSSSIKDGSRYDASAKTLTDLRDNQVYKTVTIGTQTWMAENLNYAYTGVKYNYSSYTSDSTSWCYENKASNCDKYGRLYTWSAVMDSAAQFNVNAGTKCGDGKTCTPNSPHRGICPEGWHVPTDEEYSTLYTYIGGSDTAGSLLKSTSGWGDYNGKSGNGTDKYGFSVLPAGDRRSNGDVSGEGYGAFLWSASENGRDVAWYLYFYYSGDYAYQIYNGKDYGQSLRCLKD